MTFRDAGEADLWRRVYAANSAKLSERGCLLRADGAVEAYRCRSAVGDPLPETYARPAVPNRLPTGVRSDPR